MYSTGATLVKLNSNPTRSTGNTTSACIQSTSFFNSYNEDRNIDDYKIADKKFLALRPQLNEVPASTFSSSNMVKMCDKDSDLTLFECVVDDPAALVRGEVTPYHCFSSMRDFNEKKSEVRLISSRHDSGQRSLFSSSSGGNVDHFQGSFPTSSFEDDLFDLLPPSLQEVTQSLQSKDKQISSRKPTTEKMISKPFSVERKENRACRPATILSGSAYATNNIVTKHSVDAAILASTTSSTTLVSMNNSNATGIDGNPPCEMNSTVNLLQKKNHPSKQIQRKRKGSEHLDTVASSDLASIGGNTDSKNNDKAERAKLQKNYASSQPAKRDRHSITTTPPPPRRPKKKSKRDTTQESEKKGSKITARSKELFERRFTALMAYKNEFGHCYVSRSKSKHQSIEEYELLNNWCKGIRHTYKCIQKDKNTARRYNLTDENIKRLEEAGFTWFGRDSRSFEERFNDLVRYKAEFGNCDVPHRFTRKEYKQLGSWCSNIRRSYKWYHTRDQDDDTEFKSDRVQSRCKLTTENIKRLEAIGFNWRIRDKK